MKVLITGSSKGIGKQIVDLFNLNGHDVYAPNRNEIGLSKDFKLNRTDKSYIDKYTSGGVYYIPSINKKAIFDKTTLTFKVIE